MGRRGAGQSSVNGLAVQKQSMKLSDYNECNNLKVCRVKC